MTTAGPKPVETTAAYEPRIPETGYPQRPRLVLVTCAGRSGSKWMLRLFDFHPETLCRNEPERMTPALKDPATTSWEEWERTAMDVGPRIGFVDRPPAKPKAYMRGWVKTSRADRVLYTRTLQKITGRHPEAKFPRVFYDADAVARAQRVLKVINARHFICRLLTETEHVPVVHMVRHPGGMLNSWLRRFAPTQDQEGLLERQRQILRDIHQLDPSFVAVSGPVEGKDLVELKLWCWRHAQDAMLLAGSAHPRYATVVFEDLSQNPLDVMKPIYAMCGLEYTDAMRDLIRQETERSSEIAAAWKDRMPPERVNLIERVLDSSRVAAVFGA